MNLALITSQQLFQRIDAAYKALWPANDPHMAAPVTVSSPVPPTKPLRVVRVLKKAMLRPAARVAWSCRGEWPIFALSLIA